MKSANKMVMKLLGVLLIMAALLKGYQLLTEPVAQGNILSLRAFQIALVDFELFLGSWLLSGWFPRVAWQVGLGAFAMFSLFNSYQALSGAASCGCFGPVKINPWITLLAIDLPALLALLLCRPQQTPLPHWSLRRRPGSILLPSEPRTSVRGFFFFPTNPDRQGAGYSNSPQKQNPNPVNPSPIQYILSKKPPIVIASVLLLLATTTAILALNKPAKTTSAYEVLEPSEWIGQKLPILKHIDIADQIKTGTWLLLLYHHDCPACQQAISQLEQIARQLSSPRPSTVISTERSEWRNLNPPSMSFPRRRESRIFAVKPFSQQLDPRFCGDDTLSQQEPPNDFINIALIEIPPYSQNNIGDTLLLSGQLANTKEWFVTTPVSLITNFGIVTNTWEDQTPTLESLLETLDTDTNTPDQVVTHSLTPSQTAKGG